MHTSLYDASCLGSFSCNAPHPPGPVTNGSFFTVSPEDIWKAAGRETAQPKHDEIIRRILFSINTSMPERHQNLNFTKTWTIPRRYPEVSWKTTPR